MATSGIDGNVIRVLTAVPLCDGHDSAVMAVNQSLIRNGFEVVYLGFHRSAEAIVRAAIQEDVAAIGISSYNGGHVEFFSDVVELLLANGGAEIGVFGGGGATISSSEVELMKGFGVDEIFLAGTSFEHIHERLRALYSKKHVAGEVDLTELSRDRALAVALTTAEELQVNHEKPHAKVVGFTGPGGAGKTTLIDEWVRGFLQESTEGRVAILTHDPSALGCGGLLADRASMVYAQDDRVFMRSLATRGWQGGVAPSTEACLKLLTSPQAGFDHVLVETVGTGQEALPFDTSLVDAQVLVLHPEYGARLQLEKILMLESADAVVLNKADWPGATRAIDELQAVLRVRECKLFQTQASEHRNLGVRNLRRELLG